MCFCVSVTPQNNFPEHLGCMFMINTPLLFRGFWSVIKGFLDERTLAKIKVGGTLRSWQQLRPACRNTPRPIVNCQTRTYFLKQEPGTSTIESQRVKYWSVSLVEDHCCAILCLHRAPCYCCLLQVLGSGYLPELLAVIPAENLPTMFGGKSACDCTDIGPWQVRAKGSAQHGISLWQGPVLLTPQMPAVVFWTCTGRAACRVGSAHSMGSTTRSVLEVEVNFLTCAEIDVVRCPVPCVCLQDAAVVNSDPALIKAAAGGQLGLTSGLAGSSSSNSLARSGSLIGTAISISAGSPSSSGVLDEPIVAQSIVAQ
jgi:hypothetical protein